MDYLLSFIYKQKNNNQQYINNNINVKYSNEIKIIDNFLKTSKHTNHKPGCGGCHNPNDPRVHNLYTSAMNEHISRIFIDDLLLNLPKVLKRNAKNKCLTLKLTKNYAIEYIQQNNFNINL